MCGTPTGVLRDYGNLSSCRSCSPYERLRDEGRAAAGDVGVFMTMGRFDHRNGPGDLVKKGTTAVNTDLDVPHCPDGLGLTVRIDGTQPAARPHGRGQRGVDAVERRTDRTVVVWQLERPAEQGREWPGAVGIQTSTAGSGAVRRMEKLAAVNIAAARGECGGPALDLLLAADFRIGEPGLVLMPRERRALLAPACRSTDSCGTLAWPMRADRAVGRGRRAGARHRTRPHRPGLGGHLRRGADRRRAHRPDLRPGARRPPATVA